MSVSAEHGPSASRSFVSGPYRIGEDEIGVVLPERGPCGREGSPCHLRRRCRRWRKTGPSWGWVAVVECVVHGQAFTLYPPGHVPYGRVPWVDLAPDGSEPTRGQGEEAAPPPVTLFTAASDAAQETVWPRDSAPEPPGAVRSTQRRRLLRAAELFGLVEGGGSKPETVAGATGLPAGEIVEAACALRGPVSLVVLGRRVTGFLHRLVRLAGRAVMDRLALLGHLAGLFGPPHRVEGPGSELLEIGRPFWRTQGTGTTGPPPP